MVNVDDFRQLVEHLRRKGILYNALERGPATTRALRAAGSKKQVGRFAVRPPDQTEQYRQELLTILRSIGPKTTFSAIDLSAIQKRLSPTSPFREAPRDSLKLLGLVDDRMKPLPLMVATWQGQGRPQPAPPAKAQLPVERPSTLGSGDNERLYGTVRDIKANGYGFLTAADGSTVFFHVNSLTNRSHWEKLRAGTKVSFEYGIAQLEGKPRAAHRVSLLKSNP
jgi:cold shock CspA family protein